MPKDQVPSSQISSPLWKLTLSWKQLGNQGEAIARSFGQICLCLVPEPGPLGNRPWPGQTRGTVDRLSGGV